MAPKELKCLAPLAMDGAAPYLPVGLVPVLAGGEVHTALQVGARRFAKETEV